mgnify:CR=1 FL=1
MSECQHMEEQQLEKRQSIIEAAKACFLNYGFKRTSMADIAEQVGISRPALYTHFENKEAIFRALSEQLHQASLKQAQAALREKGKIGDSLLAAFEYRSVELFALVCDSAHGEELMDINSKVAADVFREAKQEFVEMLTQALQEAQSNGEIQLENLDINTRQAAELLVNAASGLKEAVSTAEDYRLSLGRLNKVFERAVLVS